MAKSIIKQDKACFVCGSTYNLQLHHIFYGTANRKLSDKDGCIVWLCMYHHTGVNGVHLNHNLDIKIKKICQKAWQEQYNKTTEDFIKQYGRNYL